ncbi:carbon catabolite repressor protein 4 homolog 6 isoform X2 [Prunus yedoensis var. nudiflora]|uniref:Carbon catabolite repressor protein 4 homolog 6 isoform X2 n=1 Tax=Prunus yedoensis var. nudiflora TaxID=2094558 RepID=A0A314XPC5_PRUYE|nr:carbon catabolite repressor protein 4 homolog 6 isoform X2 [Prunus yedoensis var. nudiflora]
MDNDSIREGIGPDYADPLQSEIPLSKLSGQTSIADAIEVSSLGNLGNLSSKPISCVENDSRSVPEQVDIPCAPTSVDLRLSGARDSNGEPLVTSYNRCFLGTVDYIWRSEGLQTVRVLAPIPKHAMQRTSGFPTKKWGSDHIALASELAFVNSFDQS